jgi:hypothetical protein
VRLVKKRELARGPLGVGRDASALEAANSARCPLDDVNH